MDCSDVHAGKVVLDVGMVGGSAEEGTEALFELVRGLFGEGGKVDFFGLDVVEDDEVDGAPEKDAGLA
jgi:hypothetical protein